MNPPIVELKGVAKHFRAADGSARAVLEGVDFTLREGEIVALLGQSREQGERLEHHADAARGAV